LTNLNLGPENSSIVYKLHHLLNFPFYKEGIQNIIATPLLGKILLQKSYIKL